MIKKKVKAYMYTRVSTSMQADGYSLDAQKEKIRKYADAFEYEIAGEYEDAGKSGKSIAGRAEAESKGGKVEWRFCPLWV